MAQREQRRALDEQTLKAQLKVDDRAVGHIVAMGWSAAAGMSLTSLAQKYSLAFLVQKYSLY
jgi:hypothetical protein